MDEHITVGELRVAVADFVVARNWQPYHTPKHLAMSIAIETAELMEHFQWLDAADSRAAVADEQRRAAVADELADILIYCLSFANSAEIDVSSAIRAKLARNEERFPIASPPGGLSI